MVVDQNPETVFYTIKEPRNQFQGIDSASLYSQAGLYDNPILTRFLAVIKFQHCLLYGR
jgi:hypothetical protein